MADKLWNLYRKVHDHYWRIGCNHTDRQRIPICVSAWEDVEDAREAWYAARGEL